MRHTAIDIPRREVIRRRLHIAMRPHHQCDDCALSTLPQAHTEKRVVWKKRHDRPEKNTGPGGSLVTQSKPVQANTNIF